ncbi:hypothetical protein MHZ95_08275 [Sporosarcina sp. ACRSM]|uniref:hypothetical protein n=1 Tax=Sporosarcina sp. ACRSM TaxID=2918216 RepID=UPI001EF68E8C|nr:hypothetical protein [Sporosarcina sp. ACRSM]MCG7335270.1 hypothetical protein [Sporosarcina sp. ACRSM]
MIEYEKNALITAIEVFHRSCEKLHKHRNPNIYLKGNDELLSDWFFEGLRDLNPVSLGANDHPDCVINNVGFELKSLRTKGQIQFNSTIPCGAFKHNDLQGECYYVVARYKTDRTYGYLTDYSIVDGDFFNDDRDCAFAHANTQETGFGSYGDGVVRHRKMYQFPSPHRTIEGVSFISKYNNVTKFNNSLIKDGHVDRVNINGKNNRFYIYRHKLL